jgi:hypothetical protein
MSTIRTSPKSESELRGTLQSIVDRLHERQVAGSALDGIGNLTISVNPTKTEVETVRDAVAALVSKLKAAKVLE